MEESAFYLAAAQDYSAVHYNMEDYNEMFTLYQYLRHYLSPCGGQCYITSFWSPGRKKNLRISFHTLLYAPATHPFNISLSFFYCHINKIGSWLDEYIFQTF